MPKRKRMIDIPEVHEIASRQDMIKDRPIQTPAVEKTKHEYYRKLEENQKKNPKIDDKLAKFNAICEGD